MHVITTFAHAVSARAMRWLVKGHGASIVLAGTFALAGFGAAAANPPAVGGHSLFNFVHDNDHHQWHGDHPYWDTDDN